jgi:intracellular septation protein
MLAIPPFIVATFVALAIVYFLEKKVSMMLLMGGIIITLFGGLALYFDNKIFFYMKPTILFLILAGVLYFGKVFTKKSLVKILFQNKLDLKDEVWQKLNNRFIYFFIFLAILNEIVWRTQSEPFWVNFKVWGILPINLLFILSQFSLISGGKELKLQENSTTAKIDDAYFEKFRKKDKLRTTQEIKKGILNDNE